MTQQIALPPYLPPRFVGVRFANHRTGRACFVPNEALRELVNDELSVLVRASKSKAAKSSDAPLPPTDEQKKLDLGRALQDQVNEALRKLTKEGVVPSIDDAGAERDGDGDTHSEHASELDYELEATGILYGDGDADDGDSNDDESGTTSASGSEASDSESDEASESSSDDDVHMITAAKGAQNKRKTRRKQPGGSKRQRKDRSNAVALRDIDQQRRQRGTQFTQRDVAQLLQQSSARVLLPIDVPPFDPTFIHTTQELPWNRFEVLMIEHVYYRVPMVVSCINTLKGEVLSDGIKFMRENVELVPSRDFENYTVKHLQAFAAQALDAFFIYGVIPICYELDPVTKQRWPYVPTLGTFLLKRYTVRGAIRYRFYWSNERAYSRGLWERSAIKTREGGGFRYDGRMESNQDCNAYYNSIGGTYDPTVEIVHNLGYDMLSNGSLSSKLATLLATANARVRASHARATGEANAAAPTLMTEFDHQAERTQSTNFRQGYFTSASGQQPEGVDIASLTYKRDMATREAYSGLLQQFEQMSGLDAGDQFEVRHDEYRTDVGGTAVVQHSARTADGVTAPWANQYHLSSARKSVAAPQARISTDYVNFIMMLEEEVCGVLGVPRTYINGSSVKTGGEMIMNRFSDEVTRLKKLIGDVMTHVYRVLFLHEDVSDYMSSELRLARMRVQQQRNDQTSPLLTEDDLFETDSLKRVQVSFGKKAGENVEELEKLFALGGIDQRTFCAELARRNNFDPLQLRDEAEEEELDVEMKRSLYPQLAEYIKLQSAERQAKEALKSQEKQAKDQNQLHDKEIKVKEKGVKEKAKVDTHKADKQAEAAKHNAKAAEAKAATAETEAKSGGSEAASSSGSKKSSKKSKSGGGGGDGDTIKVKSYVRRAHNGESGGGGGEAKKKKKKKTKASK